MFLLTEFIYSPWKEAQAVQQQHLGAGSQEAAGTQAAAVAHASEDVQVGRWEDPHGVMHQHAAAQGI